MKTLWIDILCWESAAKTVALARREEISEVYYLNRARSFPPQAVSFFRNVIRRPVQQADTIAEGDEKIGEASLFELIYLKLTELINQFVTRREIVQRIQKFSQRNRWDPIKFKEHLREAACHNLFKVAELILFSKKISGEANSLYLLRCSFVRSLLEETIGQGKVWFYRPWLGLRSGIENRPDYLFDGMYNRAYAFDRLDFLMRLWGYWILNFVNIFLVKLWQRASKLATAPKKSAANIAVEFIQGRVRLDAINDIYWLPESGIDPQSVCAVEFEDYRDGESQSSFSRLGIRRVKFYRNPLKGILKIFKSSSKNSIEIALPQVWDWLKLFPDIFCLTVSLFDWGEKGWGRYEYVNFKVRVRFWESVYRQQDVRLVWSMHDIEPEKLIKAQAVENLDGLFLGSHWSHTPIACSAKDQKCYDVFFPWSKYFSKNIYGHYPFGAVFPVGYPLDFYFTRYREEAAALRRRYPGKFILCYQDNTHANDYPYSRQRQIDIHQWLIRLLEKYEHLVIFLKPKRAYCYQEMVRELPRLSEFVQKERIVVFLGDDLRIKAVPAKIGMASDLVVGLGIATAAAECFFAGTISLHLDLTGFRKNAFAEQSEGSVVFRDLESLREVIVLFIEGRNKLCHEDYRKYYDMLDPFQDGKAYQRTGFVIKKLQEGFQKGLNRLQAMEFARREYEGLLGLFPAGVASHA